MINTKLENILFRKPELSHYKIIISGNHVEIAKYQKPYSMNLTSNNFINKPIRKDNTEQKTVSEHSLSRARQKVRRLINSNCSFYKDKKNKKIKPQFASYTFAENLINIKEANLHFTKYIKRLNYQYFREKKAVIKYVAVLEFQKRGAVHYHVVFFNLPRIDKIKERKKRKFGKVWGHGFVDIRDITNTKNVGFYMTKYMAKKFDDKRLIKQKKYFASKKLFKPVEIKDNDESKVIIGNFFKMKLEGLNENKVENDWYGEIKYKSFNLNTSQREETLLLLNELKNRPWKNT